MKINFTKNEYRLLLDMVEMAEWVLNSHRAGSANEITKYSEIHQKILSYAKEMGFENLITYDESLGGYFGTVDYEESELLAVV